MFLSPPLETKEWVGSWWRRWLSGSRGSPPEGGGWLGGDCMGQRGGWGDPTNRQSSPEPSSGFSPTPVGWKLILPPPPGGPPSFHSPSWSVSCSLCTGTLR